MFERFTERARHAVVFAQNEARRLQHNYIGTEHLLLGLLREEEGLAARVLQSFDVTLEEVRAQIARIVGQGDEVGTGQIPFTPRAKKVLELSLREALSLGHSYIGTEHILLGIVRENEGVASRILLDFEADAYKIRNEILRMLSWPGRQQGGVQGGGLSDTESLPWGLDPQLQEPTPGYAPKSPPISPEVNEEFQRVRQRLEEAIVAEQFAEAAALRDRERRLVAATRNLERVWFRQESEEDLDVEFGLSHGSMPGRISDYGPFDYRRYFFLLGAAVFGVAAGVGLVLGWLIWG